VGEESAPFRLGAQRIDLEPDRPFQESTLRRAACGPPQALINTTGQGSGY
jgi:hypothetical protein